MRNNYKDVIYLLLDKEEDLDRIKVDFVRTKKHTPLMPKKCIKCEKIVRGKHHANREGKVMCTTCYNTNKEILHTISNALSKLN